MVKGSSVAFSALLKKMIEMDKIGICRVIARNTSPPKYAALLPQEEILDPNDNTQSQAPGFHLIFLPFADGLLNN